MSLEKLESRYDYTDISENMLEDHIEEELNDLLEGNSRAEVREMIDDLDDPEFEELVLSVFENI